jgi:hypothetical protein
MVNLLEKFKNLKLLITGPLNQKWMGYFVNEFLALTKVLNVHVENIN